MALGSGDVAFGRTRVSSGFVDKDMVMKGESAVGESWQALMSVGRLWEGLT